jgi:hypothetical protein
MAVAETSSLRDLMIRVRRRHGETLQQIGDRYGLTRERVRQIAGEVLISKQCRCGNRYETHLTNQVLCGECVCKKPGCENRLTRQQALHSGYCKPEHKPDYKGASGGATFRTVETGIYRRYYIESGLDTDGFYVMNHNTKKFERFDTLEQAQAYRASNEWRGPGTWHKETQAKRKEQPVIDIPGREKHDWFKPSENGYPHLGPWESCRKCGVVKNDRNKDALRCRGVVRISLRKEQS